ncbi:MAG: sigma-70 family RNA polymerase sigma factor [Candidatus Eisenbacteria bacterium]|uniref:Sigma-70 family RNA polymerase sigma factor n=1 Tax=Eiseniibacteriota bacterium TaxID=2212470 RepID=A0A7Y2EAX8_UNCEI|nr:sigma-70 family RNA polymerase sigma factor [Candidatus Eisenbacteria bacterium]
MIEESVFKRAIAQDPRAWEELLAAYGSLIYGTAIRVGCGPDDAADVSQKVWVSLFEGIGSIRESQALPRWLAVTTKRIAVHHLTSQRRHYGDEIVDEHMSSDPSVEELLAAEDEAARVRKAIEQLPEQCRQLLPALFENEKVEYHQVSQALGVPVGSIGPTRARCLAKLAKILAKKDA